MDTSYASFSDVPEPSTAVLMLAALAGLIFFRWGRFPTCPPSRWVLLGALFTQNANSASITSANVDLTISPVSNLSDVYLVEGYTPALGLANQPTLYSLGSLTANTSRTFQGVPDFLYSGTSIFGGPIVNYFTIIGLYDVPNGLVTVGFRGSVASFFIGSSAAFGVAVPTSVSNGFSGTESALATALQNGDTATIGSVLATLIGLSYSGLGTEAAPIVIGSSVTGSLTLDNFSSASPGGTASLALSAIPEPGSAILLSAGLLMLAFRAVSDLRM